MFNKKTKISSLLVGTALVGMTASTANTSFFSGSFYKTSEHLFTHFVLPVGVTLQVQEFLPEKLNPLVKSVVSFVAGLTVLSIAIIKEVLEEYIEKSERGEREANKKENKIDNETEEKDSKKSGKTKNDLVNENSSSKYVFLP